MAARRSHGKSAQTAPLSTTTTTTHTEFKLPACLPLPLPLPLPLASSSCLCYSWFNPLLAHTTQTGEFKEGSSGIKGRSDVFS